MAPGSRRLQEGIIPFAFLHLLRFYFKVCSADRDYKLIFYKDGYFILFDILILFFYGVELLLNMVKDNKNLPGVFWRILLCFQITLSLPVLQ